MRTKVGTIVTLEDGKDYVVLDIAEQGGKEYAYAYMDDGDEKNPKICFFSEEIEGKDVYAEMVTEPKLMVQLAKKFKIRAKL